MSVMYFINSLFNMLVLLGFAVILASRFLEPLMPDAVGRMGVEWCFLWGECVIRMGPIGGLETYFFLVPYMILLNTLPGLELWGQFVCKHLLNQKIFNILKFDY